MALAHWNDSFSVNVLEIDLQHKKLISMINELDEAMRRGEGKNILGKIVDHLINYAGTHFKTEEKYFAQFEYPDANKHKQEHAAFVQKVTDFKVGFNERRLSLTIEVMNFLSDWLKRHIMESDKQYGRFFNEKGLK